MTMTMTNRTLSPGEVIGAKTVITKTDMKGETMKYIAAVVTLTLWAVGNVLGDADCKVEKHAHTRTHKDWKWNGEKYTTEGNKLHTHKAYHTHLCGNFDDHEHSWDGHTDEDFSGYSDEQTHGDEDEYDGRVQSGEVPVELDPEERAGNFTDAERVEIESPPPSNSQTPREDDSENTDDDTNNGGSSNTGPRESSTSSSTIRDTLDDTARSSSRSSSTTIHYEIDEYISEPEPEVEPEPDPVILSKHRYDFFQGYTIIGFPVRTFDDEHNEYKSEIEDFYEDADCFDSPSEGIIMHIHAEGVDKQWYLFDGEGSLGNMPTGGNYGVIVKQDYSVTTYITGVAQNGHPSHLIKVGINLIGFPVIPSLYKRPSDFITIDEIYSVIVSHEEGFSAVFREGDIGDDLFYEGQGIILFSSVEMRLDLSSSVSAAPQASRARTVATSWGAIKRQ